MNRSEEARQQGRKTWLEAELIAMRIALFLWVLMLSPLSAQEYAYLNVIKSDPGGSFGERARYPAASEWSVVEERFPSRYHLTVERASSSNLSLERLTVRCDGVQIYELHGRKFWIGAQQPGLGWTVFHRAGGSHGALTLLLFDFEGPIRELGRLDSPLGTPIGIHRSKESGQYEFRVKSTYNTNEAFSKAHLQTQKYIWSSEKFSLLTRTRL